MRALHLVLVLLAAPALAGERYDHKGSVGLLLGGALEQKESSALGGTDHGLRFDLDLGGTIAIGYDGNDLVAFGRATIGGPVIDWSLTGGYRGYFGQDRLHTFFDLMGSAHFTPTFTAGPRVGFGVQYEVASVAGIYTGLAVQVGFGGALRFDAELVLGVQLRSYLLE